MEQDAEATARWALEPERVDPDDFAPSAPFAKQITWASCDRCGIQVHTPVTQFLYAGLVCPGCGDTLLSPPDEPEDWVRRVMREEDEFSEQL